MSHETRTFGHKFDVEVSSIEIYCEQVRDLFTGDEIDLKTEIGTKKVHLANQSWIRVTRVNEFLVLIKQAQQRRVSGKNDYHDHSSRSHHIFQVKLTSNHKQSLLNIVDLAGSERQLKDSP